MEHEKAIRITTHPELIFRLKQEVELSLRRRILQARKLVSRAPPVKAISFSEWNGNIPYDTIACSDAGSNILPLIRPSYFCMAECLEWPSYTRFFEGPKEVHSSSVEEAKRYVDLLREYMRLKVMLSYLESLKGCLGKKLLILDGPIIPPCPSWPSSSDTKQYRQLFKEYLRLLVRVTDIASAKGYPLIGFVKRPDTSWLKVERLADAEWLALWLKYGQAYPWPPTEPPMPEHHKLPVVIRFTYLQSSSEELSYPYRIDLSGSVNDEEALLICRVLLRLSDSTGIPAPVKEVDYDVKIKKKWLKSIYEDVRTSVQADLPFGFWRLIGLRYGE